MCALFIISCGVALHCGFTFFCHLIIIPEKLRYAFSLDKICRGFRQWAVLEVKVSFHIACYCSSVVQAFIPDTVSQRIRL